MEEIPVFRAAKRRKHARGPSQLTSDSISPEPTTLAIDQVHGNNVDLEINTPAEADADVSTLVKARKQFKRPVTGVHFSTLKAHLGQDDGNDEALVRADQSVEKPMDITQRFIGSSGHVVNVDQHMFVPPHLCPAKQSSNISLLTR